MPRAEPPAGGLIQKNQGAAWRRPQGDNAWSRTARCQGNAGRAALDRLHPETERHGRLYSQFTLWLGANLQITAIVTGALAVVLGGDVFWSLVGLFVGQVFGGAVMALHAAQGPKLGLPQMISSRVQFGSMAPPSRSCWCA